MGTKVFNNGPKKLNLRTQRQQLGTEAPKKPLQGQAVYGVPSSDAEVLGKESEVEAAVQPTVDEIETATDETTEEQESDEVQQSAE